MAENYNSICITSVKNTVLSLAGLDIRNDSEKANTLVESLSKNKLGDKKCDRFVLYNPDAVALWLYQIYTE